MADETHDTPPLSDERLAEIRARVDDQVATQVEAEYLLAEVDRLRAREAAAMAIVRDVANPDLMYPAPDGAPRYLCLWCPASAPRMIAFQHASDCPVTRARALLAEE